MEREKETAQPVWLSWASLLREGEGVGAGRSGHCSVKDQLLWKEGAAPELPCSPSVQRGHRQLALVWPHQCSCPATEVCVPQSSVH